MAVGVSVSVLKVAVYSRMTEVNSFYARVVADGGTISDFSALRLAVLDYKAVQSLEPSLYTFASGRKAGTQYSLVPADGSGDISVTRSGDTAMELNANGFWQPAAANVPRYDYVSGRPMINVEELRTNLLPRYKTFPHSDWTKSGARIECDPSTAGAELVVNGDFSGGTANWTVNSPITLTISSGQANIARNSGAVTQFPRQAIISAGKLYKITGTIVALSHNVSVYAGGSEQVLSSIGIFTVYLSGGSDGLGLRIGPTGDLNATCIIDNISVQEVTGYASPFVDSAGANLMDGYKLVATANNGYIRLATAVTVTAATTYSNSIWIKRVTGTGQAYIIDTNTTDRAITLTTQWQRFEYSAAAGSTSGQIGVKLAVAGDEVLIAHAQLEVGATASSPIGGAEGSAQTRNADIIVKTGASALIGQTEGYAVVEVNITKFFSAGRYLLALYNNLSSVANSIRLYFPSNRIDLSVFNSSGVESNLSIKTITSTGIYKIGIAWKDNDCVLVVNSEVITATKSGALGVSNLSNIVIGANRVITELLNDRIKLVDMGKTRISNEKLIELTTL